MPGAAAGLLEQFVPVIRAGTTVPGAPLIGDRRA